MGEDEKRQDAAEALEAKSPRKDRKKLTIGVVVAVVLVAAVGMFAWHGQPSFCGTVCHTPMELFVETYYAEPGQPGSDKWGNEVADSSAMMSVVHRTEADNVDCLACHVPSIGEQVNELGLELNGDYWFPLSERSTEDLMVNSEQGEEGDEFCLRAGCHDVTRAEMGDMEAVKDMVRNPHSWKHGEVACSECHKSHRASVMYCTQCHSDADVPEGWVTYDEGQQIEQEAMNPAPEAAQAA